MRNVKTWKPCEKVILKSLSMFYQQSVCLSVIFQLICVWPHNACSINVCLSAFISIFCFLLNILPGPSSNSAFFAGCRAGCWAPSDPLTAGGSYHSCVNSCNFIQSYSIFKKIFIRFFLLDEGDSEYTYDIFRLDVEVFVWLSSIKLSINSLMLTHKHGGKLNT